VAVLPASKERSAVTLAIASVAATFKVISMIELNTGLPVAVSFEQKRQWEAEAVEKARQTHGNSDLWQRLLELDLQQAAIEEKLPEYFNNAHGAKANVRYWQKKWHDLIAVYNANADLMKVYAWHLQQRGDTSVEMWLNNCLKPQSLILDS
jgi:hypothetical protein